MVKDQLYRIASEFLQESGREEIVSYSYKHKNESSIISCHLLESAIHKHIKIAGFRNSNTAPEEILIKKLVAASIQTNSLEQYILQVWADLKRDMQETAKKIISQNKDVVLSVINFDGDSEDIDKLYSLVDMLADQLLEECSCTNGEARLMTSYLLNRAEEEEAIDDIDPALTNDEGEPVIAKNEELGQVEQVDLYKWLSCLQILPASSEIWDEVESFSQKLNELAGEKKREKERLGQLAEVINHLRENWKQELAYFEIKGIDNWSATDVATEHYEHLCGSAEKLEQLLIQHKELQNKKFATKNAEQQRRREVDDYEAEIDHLFQLLNTRLALHPGKEQDGKMKRVPQDVVDQDANHTVEISLDSPQIKPASRTDPIGIGILYTDSQEGAGSETETEKPPVIDKSQGSRVLQQGATKKISLLGGSKEKKTEIFGGKASGDPEANNDLNNNLEKVTGLGSEVRSNAETQEQSVNSEKIVQELVTVEGLFQTIQEACLTNEDIPRAWILLQAYQKRYGNREELGTLPTATLLEIYYLGQQIHREPVLIRTRRQKLDQIASELKTSGLSSMQAVMHFAVALPLTMAYSCDVLRSSFFYSDYIPQAFQPMYNSLVEHINQVNVPIIDLCSAEQRQHQNDKQRRKLTRDLEQVFYKFSLKHKTKMDEYFFPLYGKGPLQWVLDGIKGSACTDVFKEKLAVANADNIFAEFSDSKLTGITALRRNNIEKIQHVLDLASAWDETCAMKEPPEDYQYKAFKQLQLLLEENYEHWNKTLKDQSGDFLVATLWMKQGLEQLVEYIRGADYAAGNSR